MYTKGYIKIDRSSKATEKQPEEDISICSNCGTKEYMSQTDPNEWLCKYCKNGGE